MAIRRSTPHRQRRDDRVNMDSLDVELDPQIIDATPAEVRSKAKYKYIQRAYSKHLRTQRVCFRFVGNRRVVGAASGHAAR